LPADAIKIIVRHGQNGMPAFRPTEITNSELEKLGQWISASKADPKELGK
jgi:mono/diheme cytochrome c family protein